MLLDADPLVSFAWIMGAALLAPLLSYATGKRLPAVVLLIGFGLVIGPNVLGLASLDGGVGLIKEIGLGMLFCWLVMRLNLKHYEVKRVARG